MTLVMVFLRVLVLPTIKLDSFRISGCLRGVTLLISSAEFVTSAYDYLSLSRNSLTLSRMMLLLVVRFDSRYVVSRTMMLAMTIGMCFRWLIF